MKDIRNILNVHNVGYSDAAIRGMLGMAALYPVFMQLQTWGASLAALLSIYPLLTAICRWDPFYELFNFATTKVRVARERQIERFLELSRQYFRSLAGTERLDTDLPAANDHVQQRKSA